MDLIQSRVSHTDDCDEMISYLFRMSQHTPSLYTNRLNMLASAQSLMDSPTLHGDLIRVMQCLYRCLADITYEPEEFQLSEFRKNLKQCILKTCPVKFWKGH